LTGGRRAERAEQLLARSALKLDDVAHAIGTRSKATVYRLLHKSAHDART
jgi:methylphosphotriester-DNA--protein-cysteine methyltransferase